MTASDKSKPPDGPHRVQLRAAHAWTIADYPGEVEPTGVDRLYLMVTAVFDRLTDGEKPVPKTEG
jgi:hypothetical protein